LYSDVSDGSVGSSWNDATKSILLEERCAIEASDRGFTLSSIFRKLKISSFRQSSPQATNVSCTRAKCRRSPGLHWKSADDRAASSLRLRELVFPREKRNDEITRREIKRRIIKTGSQMHRVDSARSRERSKGDSASSITLRFTMPRASRGKDRSTVIVIVISYFLNRPTPTRDNGHVERDGSEVGEEAESSSSKLGKLGHGYARSSPLALFLPARSMTMTPQCATERGMILARNRSHPPDVH